MSAVICRAALLLCVVLGLLIGLTCAAPLTVSVTPLLPDTTCGTLCWQGVELGVTTAEEALAVLEAHPWMDDVTLVGGLTMGGGEGWLAWKWNGDQPFAAEAGLGGSLAIAQDVVENARVQTTIPFGEIWLALGSPAQGAVTAATAPFQQYDIYYAAYPERRLAARTVVANPPTPKTFWEAPVELTIGPEVEFGGQGYPLPCWYACG